MASSSSYFKIFAHVSGWTLFIITPLLFAPSHEVASYFTDLRILWSHLLRNTLLIALFYFNLLYLTPTLLPTRGMTYFIPTLLLLIFFVSAANWYIHESMTGMFQHFPRPFREPPFDRPPMPPPNDSGFNRPRPVMLAGPYFASFLITTVVASASTVIVLWNNWVKAREHEQTMTFEKVAAELSVLKLQISPHFLFNTLNNIRWLVRSKSEHAETAVIKLSHLLRYILYQTNESKVSLEKEIEHLKDYVSLQQMRLVKTESVSFEVNGNPEGKQIVPLLLIPFVENFFKHADFEDSIVNKIKIDISANHLIFETDNAVVSTEKKQPNESDSGIGLENVKRRLALHYPDQHLIRYENRDGKFTLHLEIILS
jgi:hypothetical protein